MMKPTYAQHIIVHGSWGDIVADAVTGEGLNNADKARA
jgi:hypothetical protein